MHYELQINTKSLRKTNRSLLNFNFHPPLSKTNIVLLFSVNCLYIMFLKVLLDISITDDFISELLVEYNLILFFSNKSFT